MKHKFLLGLCFLLMQAVATTAQVSPDDITGFWLTHGDKPGKIQIYKQGGKFYGKIAWIQTPTENGKPLVDKKNPNQSLQSRPILGLELLTGFGFDKDEWNGGQIYDPDSGKTYSCTLSLKEKNTLKVR